MPDKKDRGDRSSGPLMSVDFWLPNDLSRRITALSKAERRTIAKPVFLRKAVELYEPHHSDPSRPGMGYPDVEQLHAAFGRLKSDPLRSIAAEAERDVYLDMLNEAQNSGMDPSEAGFTLAQVAMTPVLVAYMESEAAVLPRPSAQAFGLIATHELYVLYEIAGTATQP